MLDELNISWVNEDYFPFNMLYRSDTTRVVHMYAISPNIRILKCLTPRDHVIANITWDYDRHEFVMAKRILEMFELDLNKVHILCNTELQVKIATKVGLSAYLMNQNALINDELFKIKTTEKKYDAVMNARMAEFKRPELAKKVPNLALIAGIRTGENRYCDPETIPHRYLSKGFLYPIEVRTVLNQSKVGLILSEKEGACFASSEYLLTGLPVVSTKSTGGRDTWYNEENAVICDATPEAVRDATLTAIEKLETGVMKPKRIREMHLEQAKPHRRVFCEILNRIFDDIGITVDSRKLFRHKLPHLSCSIYKRWNQVMKLLA